MQTPFFDSLIDDFGIWQHTDGTMILKGEGYALDDAARGLLVCLALHKLPQAEVLFTYLERSSKGNGFYGFATDTRQFIRFPASDDATAQVAWAMGYAIHHHFHDDRAQQLLGKIKPTLLSFNHVRGPAYGLLGALYAERELALAMYRKLCSFFNDVSTAWPWPEPIMTYGNGLLPYVFLRYALVADDQEAARKGRALLQFVQAKSTKGRPLGPIGNEGWLPKEAHVAPNYSQQPIDAAYMIWAWLAAFELSKEHEDFDHAREWWGWFEGKNIARTKMYDANTLEAYDGIDKEGVHYHSGAESNICLLLSKCMLETGKTI